MIYHHVLYVLSILTTCSKFIYSFKYDPTWDSLDQRPLPTWYDEAKVGIFIHWSVWSVPAAGFNESAYLWNKWKSGQPEAVDYMKKNYPPNFTYQDFAAEFKAEFYDPTQWLQLFQQSGAKYVVFVSKHHEGYCMWPSNHSFNWNVGDVGPKRDILGDLIKTVRSNSDLKIGVYYSLFEWYNPIYLNDKASNYTLQDYVERKMLPELKDLTENYLPDVIWSDGDWEAFSDYWDSKEFLAWLYNDSPVKDQVVVNDRWGIDALCKHGGFLTCTDKFNPGHLVSRKWENAMTLDLGSWGFRHNIFYNDVIPIYDLITQLIQTVSCGGNILINIGPPSDGTIPVILEEKLRELGQWLQINGEAIYATIPWFIQTDQLNSTLVWYTSKNGSSSDTTNIYALFLVWPGLLSNDEQKLVLQPTIKCANVVNVTIFGVDDDNNFAYNRKIKTEFPSQRQLKWICDNNNPYKVYIQVNDIQINNIDYFSEWAWTIRITAKSSKTH